MSRTTKEERQKARKEILLINGGKLHSQNWLDDISLRAFKELDDLEKEEVKDD